MPATVRNVFEQYPDATRQQLAALRETIYEVAARTEGVGPLEETLKWGQVSYLTPQTRSGTTIRIDAAPDNTEQVAMFCHCQTTLIDTFRSRYGDLFEYEGTRSIRFTMNDAPADALEDCIALALTYHLRKKKHAPAS